MAAKDNMDTTKNENMDAVATVVAAFAQRADVSSDQIVDLAARLMPVFGGTAPQTGTSAPRYHQRHYSLLIIQILHC